MKRQLQGLVLAATVGAGVLGASLAQAQVPISQTPLASPVQSSGLSGGSRASACGFLPTTANQQIQVTEAFSSLNIEVTGEGKLTLLIEGPNGFSECVTTDRFSEGYINAPGLLNQGLYNIYVGNENSVQTQYTLTISQN